MNSTTRNPTREVQIGRTTIGGDHPIAVQSMAATRTQDTEATIRQLRLLAEAGADVIRVAVDSKKDVEALAQIAPTVDVPLSVDLQENYRLVRSVAPHVEKIRYNPGHLYHHEKNKPVADKVAFIADEAAKHDCALRVGVNCGSVDPAQAERFPTEDSISPMIASALEHCELLDGLGFHSLLRLAQGLRSCQGHCRQHPLCPRAARCAAAPWRHRGRDAPRRRDQDPHCL